MTSTIPSRIAFSRRFALAGLLALPLAACGNAASSDKTADPAASDSGSDGATHPVTITDPWVKATDTDMTAAFGVLHNTGKKDLTLTAASCADAGMVELHEVTDGKMHPVDGGMKLPAGGELTLEPGGYHVMLMGLKRELVPGDELKIELTFEDGLKLPVTAVVKDYSGAKEDYAPGASDGGGHDAHDHGAHDDHAHDHDDHNHDGHNHDDHNHDEHGGH